MLTSRSNAKSLASAYSVIAHRRSPAPHSLIGPGPNARELNDLLNAAIRVPDHGRLSPWRLIVIQGEHKDRWIDRLMDIAERRADAPKARATIRKLQSAPIAVIVVASPTLRHKVPEWEQALSAGAVAMNLLNAAHALGFGGHWLTGWEAYDPQATALVDLQLHEKVAGCILVGNVDCPAPERPRACIEQVVRWLEI